jgi:hypothetical protein
MADRDRTQAVTLAVVGGVAALALAGLVIWGAATLVPQVQAWAMSVFSPGLGLKTSAIIAAVVSFLALIALTVTAGDGLIGEIQFVIPGFFLFFLFFWLMTAWVF